MEKLPEVFKINRVNKAIVSLAERVASARNIAESIPQIKTAVLNLKDKDKQQSNVPDDSTPIPPKQERDLELGAIFPNTFMPLPEEKQKRLFMLVVDKGEPSEFYVTNIEGDQQRNWNPKEIEEKDCNNDIRNLARIIRNSNRDAKLHFISMTVPEGIKADSCYYFVAKLQGAKVEDRLLLTASNTEFCNSNHYLETQ